MTRYKVETDKGSKTVIAETRQEAIAKAVALGLTVLRARREEPISAPVPLITTDVCHGCQKEIAIKGAHKANGKAMFSGQIITVVDHYCDSCWAARNSKLISDGEVTK
jgi:hypothetical protein